MDDGCRDKGKAAEQMADGLQWDCERLSCDGLKMRYPESCELHHTPMHGQAFPTRSFFAEEVLLHAWNKIAGDRI